MKARANCQCDASGRSRDWCGSLATSISQVYVARASRSRLCIRWQSASQYRVRIKAVAVVQPLGRGDGLVVEPLGRGVFAFAPGIAAHLFELFDFLPQREMWHGDLFGVR